MFCDGCGNQLQAGGGFCSRCGKQISGPTLTQAPVMMAPAARRSRVHDHIHFLAILWMALSAASAVGAAILYGVANTMMTHWSDMGNNFNGQEWLHPFLSALAVALLVKAAAGFAAGWGLMHREPWARTLTIVLAFIALFHVPFGTALGIYTLWVLLPAGADREYEELGVPRAA
jgi:hypothetical protein